MEMKDYTLLPNLIGYAINIEKGSEKDHLQLIQEVKSKTSPFNSMRLSKRIASHIKYY